ncbi:hypothetical protein DSM112329_03518 [Paraconexibacter sp. AEG42_29]|uniref:Thioredoxin domain-containing protein n=1 Tax=Paraconexibacter sp. AEG42_29 TaxID=2997339 RepID=A0AAU7AYB1_9ACTN
MLARVQLTLAAALALVALGLGAILLFGPDGEIRASEGQGLSVGPYGWVGSLAPPDIRRRDFTLPDENGRPFALASARGKVTVLTWMYSTCLDSCQATASTIKLALDDLGKTADDVPVIAVSVDPVGDTRTNVRSFLLKQTLFGRMTYLRGTRAQLAPVWDAYKVQQQGPGTKLSDSHTVSVLLIGRDGKQRLSLPVDSITPEALAHDLRKLIGEKS